MRYDFSQEVANEMLERADATNDELTSQIVELRRRMDEFKSDYTKLHTFKDTLPKVYQHEYFFGGENIVDSYIKLMNFLIGYTGDDAEKGFLGLIFGVRE